MDNIQFVIKDYNLDNIGIGNVLKCLISGLSINEDTKIQCYNDYIYGNYDTILDEKFIFNGKTNKSIEKILTPRLLILKNEENKQQDIPNEEWYMNALNNYKFNHYFSFSKRIDWNYDPNKISYDVKQRIFNVIDKITFLDIINDTVNNFYSLFNNSNSLGLSVRTWKAKHEKNIQRKYDFNTYKNKIIDVININKDINMIILSIDNHEFENDYINLFNELKINFLIINQDNLNDIQFAITKALILSKCNYFIGNRISTFTELVFWFGKFNPKVYTVF